MAKFYIKKALRFVNEFTNFKYREIENNILMQQDIKNAILQNIEKMHSLLRNNLVSVNEYMKILSDIENYTIDRLEHNELINQYMHIFNNCFVNVSQLTVSNTECTFTFETYHQLITFFIN